MKKSTSLVIFCSCLFFILSYITLKDYGMSWDETIHFRRGQAYVHYFLTGNKNYNDLPKTDFRRSFYQNDYHNGEHWETYDIGHPPLSDELAALFNVVLFQKFGIADDITSFHIYNILAGTFIVCFVIFFAARTFGNFTGIITFLVLITYPLFWAESHFNMKDVAETIFFTGFIFSFYRALAPSKTWLFISSVFFGLSLGTKFNVLFTPLIIIPYLFIRLRRDSLKLSKGYLMTILSWPFVVCLIFVGTWPFLWWNPDNILKIFQFYRLIGVGTNYQPEQFYFLGFNTFPLQWIIFTTPPLVLILLAVGLFSCWKERYKFHSITILWLLWLLVPIARVSIPGVSIYGGVRQIFEFIPALALVSGMGAYQIVTWLTHPQAKKIAMVLITLAFLWPIQSLISLHPNENVYFNGLIGGLPGAKERSFPSWGNSFGNAYFQGINWINTHVEKNAKLALIQGTPANVPAILLRKDIQYIYSDTEDKSYFSGDAKRGEYLMELTYNDSYKPNSETWQYVEKYLVPVYEVKVEGVSILKIWKNE